jgi:DNA-binding NarL/FixJ family response regulator
VTKTQTSARQRAPRVYVAIVAPPFALGNGASRALAKHPAVDVILTGASLEECRLRLKACDPDVVVIAAPGGALPPTVRGVQRLVPRARVVVCGGSPNDACELLACARSGAMGFVGAGTRPEALIAVVQGVARGEVWCATPAAALLLREMAGHQSVADLRTPLSAREREVLNLMSTHSNKSIAYQLNITLSTTKNHVHSILAKFGLRRRRDVAALMHAWENGRANGDLDPFRLHENASAP